ncbi:hypothetical protein Taro_038333 [Colocasia esculenta]|uniref:tRNA (adenine(58)-N(1))-methyltransferase n=1 Tax=Colocasia esculenta TaxID=4460 RepID=A0A843WNF1_COLES|nr:hypothetical protein [Colocasia esculenta]
MHGAIPNGQMGHLGFPLTQKTLSNTAELLLFGRPKGRKSASPTSTTHKATSPTLHTRSALAAAEVVGRTHITCSTKVSKEEQVEMMPSDPDKQITFQRRIRDGDLVIVYERHDAMKAVTVRAGSELQNRFGVFKHSDWVGKPFGSKVLSSKGGFVYLLAPTPELWTLVLSHRTQILYVADISFVVSYLEVVPGCLVLESGTGSGSLTTSLARAVAPSGHVYTFDFHEQRAASARYAYWGLVFVLQGCFLDVSVFSSTTGSSVVSTKQWDKTDWLFYKLP